MIMISVTSFVCGTPLFAFFDHSGQIRGRTDLEGTRLLHAGVLGHELDGMLEILRLENQDAADLLLRLRIGSVGDGDLSVFPSQGGSAPGTLERFTAGEVAIPSQEVVVGKALINHGVPILLRKALEFIFFDIS